MSEAERSGGQPMSEKEPAQVAYEAYWGDPPTAPPYPWDEGQSWYQQSWRRAAKAVCAPLEAEVERLTGQLCKEMKTRRECYVENHELLSAKAEIEKLNGRIKDGDQWKRLALEALEKEKRLTAENAQIRAECQAGMKLASEGSRIVMQIGAENSRLRREVERLREALEAIDRATKFELPCYLINRVRTALRAALTPSPAPDTAPAAPEPPVEVEEDTRRYLYPPDKRTDACPHCTRLLGVLHPCEACAAKEGQAVPVTADPSLAWCPTFRSPSGDWRSRWRG